jgi:uncharacterized repeat protein (TIGR03803 family)
VLPGEANDMEGEGRKPTLIPALALAVVVALTMCAPAYAAPKYQVLHSFNGTDGSGPWGGVILDETGNVYGATADGGIGECGGGPGCGLVFELTRQAGGNWTETVLYSFRGGASDGEASFGNLVFDNAGNLYGTTNAGGTYDDGTVFELTPDAGGWSESVLHSFGTRDGGRVDPTAGPIVSPEGDLYGTTPGGGINKGGVAFELAPSSGGWDETVLHSFRLVAYGHPAPGGSNPYAGLILDASGNLYGTTQWGGIACAGEGCGTVYELKRTSGGWNKIVLHRFNNNGKDGVEPGWGALFMDASGNLYGTTRGGGCCGGVVFKLTPKPRGQWQETVLYAFQGGADGYEPNAGVVVDKAGNLYGSTDYGGQGCGVIYKLAPRPKGKWKYTVLYSFYGGVDGCIPEGNLVLDKKGNLYGSTVLAGSGGYGVVFELTP